MWCSESKLFCGVVVNESEFSSKACRFESRNHQKLVFFQSFEKTLKGGLGRVLSKIAVVALTKIVHLVSIMFAIGYLYACLLYWTICYILYNYTFLFIFFFRVSRKPHQRQNPTYKLLLSSVSKMPQRDWEDQKEVHIDCYVKCLRKTLEWLF